MDDELLFEAKGVKVTKKRVILHGTTFPVANLTSVKVVPVSPSSGSWLFLVLVGLFVAAVGVLLALPALSDPTWSAQGILVPTMAVLLGVGTVVVGGQGLVKQKTSYAVVLGTAGAERRAFATQDRQVADDVREAIDMAITG